MEIIVDLLIDVPPGAVFARATDVVSWPQFISGIQSVELLTPGPVSVGTRFRETRMMFGRQATEEMTFAELDPPHRFVLTAFNHGTTYRAEHLFNPHGAGTRMTLAFQARPTTRRARLFAPLGSLFLGTVKRQLEADLADLKRAAEQRHRDQEA